MANFNAAYRRIIDNMNQAWQAQGMLPKTVSFSVCIDNLPNGMFKAYAVVEPYRHIWAQSIEQPSYAYAVAHLLTWTNHVVATNAMLYRLGTLGTRPGETNNIPWTDAEKEALLQLRNEAELDWEGIAEILDPRTAAAVEAKYYALVRPNARREAGRLFRWTGQEDRTLIDLRFRYGPEWRHFSTQMPGRTPAACQSRFNQLARDYEARLANGA